MIDLVIANGLVVSPGQTYLADIAVNDGRIEAIGSASLFGRAHRVIDASGKYLLPGLIDVHTHLEAPLRGCTGAFDFYTGSVAAACSGVTTLIDFTNTGTTIMGAIRARLEEMEKSAVDYGLHVVVNCSEDPFLAGIKEAVEFGCPTFKLFTTYRKEGFMLDDPGFLRVFDELRRYGGLPVVHAESDAIAQRNIAAFAAAGQLGWSEFAASKPQLCELEAVQRVILLARFAGVPLYICHLTSAEGLAALRRAQSGGQAVYAETCPHYLTFTKERYDGPGGISYLMSPPLKEAEDREALWEGLAAGVISVVSSDDCAYKLEEKMKFLGRDQEGRPIPDFTRVANGVPGLAERPLVLLEGVHQGRISINQLVGAAAANPARIMGLYPRKGVIQPGSDADLVLVDPHLEREITPQALHQELSYSIYAGRTVHGWPVMTISRGRVIAEQGEFTGRRGVGAFLKRKLSFS